MISFQKMYQLTHIPKNTVSHTRAVGAKHDVTDFFKVETLFLILPTSCQNELPHLLTIYRYS